MKTRMKTHDVAFQFRMGAGSPGDVNRTHPASIEVALNCIATPVTLFGVPVLVDAASQGVRPFTAADQSDTVAAGYGLSVRPYPFQQSSATNFGEATFGAATAPAGAIDLLRSGYIMAKLNAGTAVKGAPVYIWCAASSGAHVLGGIEGTFASGSTTKLLNATFNGGAGSDGAVEIAFNI